jgi:hypothetical protein
MTAASANFDREWADLRRRFRISRLSLLGFVPGIVLMALSVFVFQEWLFGVGALSLMLGLLIYSVAVTYRMAFRCPRCRNWFFASWWTRNPSAEKCEHCGLERWSGLLGTIDLHSP